MKKLAITAGVLMIGLVAASCESQVTAQNNLPVAPPPSPASPVENQLFPAPPDPGPVGTPPTLPPVVNSAADIGELGARQKALEIAAKRHGENNPKIIRVNQLSYNEAAQLWPEVRGLAPAEYANLPVRSVEMEGVFRIPRRSIPRGVSERPQTARKLHLIFRATDGLLLETNFLY